MGDRLQDRIDGQWKVHHKDKGKLVAKLVKQHLFAEQAGSDWNRNPRLRLAMGQVVKSSIPRETLDRAFRQFGGPEEGERVRYDAVDYEGYAPHRVPLIVECLTDNVDRTNAEMRELFSKGKLRSDEDCDFERFGLVKAIPENAGADPELAGSAAGAWHVEPAEDGSTLFIAPPTDLDGMKELLPKQGFAVISAEIGYIPVPVRAASLSAEDLAEAEAFLEAIYNHDDVQDIRVGLLDA